MVPKPPAQNCSIHDLAIGPSGQCVLCDRFAPPVVAQPAPEPDPVDRGRRAFGVAAMVSVLGLVLAMKGRLPLGRWLHSHSRANRTLPGGAAASRLGSARSDVVITMYSTSWCGVCAAARTYMTDHDIAFTDYDVEQDAEAGARARQLNPRGSVPTITIDDELLIGFGGEALEERIDRAAQARAANGGKPVPAS